LLAQVPYRKALNFTFDGLKSAATAIDRIRNFDLRLRTAKFEDGTDGGLDQRAQVALDAFRSAMDDDLNTAEALGSVFEFIRDVNTTMDRGEFKAGNVASAKAVLDLFDLVFDVLKPTPAASAFSDAEIEVKIEERRQAKRARNFAEADQIRVALLDRGVIIEDTKDGVRWKRK